MDFCSGLISLGIDPVGSVGLCLAFSGRLVGTHTLPVALMCGLHMSEIEHDQCVVVQSFHCPMRW